MRSRINICINYHVFHNKVIIFNKIKKKCNICKCYKFVGLVLKYQLVLIIYYTSMSNFTPLILSYLI